MSKQRLGKGLGALIPEFKNEDTFTVQGQKILDIPVEQISFNPRQPRKDISLEKLQEMADTIKAYGIIQPVIVHKDKEKEKYILVAGERRFRAAKLAGLKSIPALVRDYSEEELLEVALVENLQREDLNPLEEAAAFQKLIEEFSYTQEELAQKIGRSRSAISNALRLLALDEEVKKYLREGRLTAGQARPLLAVSDPEQQRSLAIIVMEQKLSARQVEELIKKIKRKSEEKEEEKESAQKKSLSSDLHQLYYRELEEKIRRIYGTKVNIRREKKEGKIELYFYGEDDLERLVNILLKKNDE